MLQNICVLMSNEDFVKFSYRFSMEYHSLLTRKTKENYDSRLGQQGVSVSLLVKS